MYLMVVEAHDLTGKDFSGLSDPYVKLRIGTQEKRTEIMFQTLGPHWFEKFRLDVSGPEDAFLRVEVRFLLCCFGSASAWFISST